LRDFFIGLVRWVLRKPPLSPGFGQAPTRLIARKRSQASLDLLLKIRIRDGDQVYTSPGGAGGERRRFGKEPNIRSSFFPDSGASHTLFLHSPPKTKSSHFFFFSLQPFFFVTKIEFAFDLSAMGFESPPFSAYHGLSPHTPFVEPGNPPS